MRVERVAGMDDQIDVESPLRSARTSAPERPRAILGQVFEGPERRRRWTTEDKLRILAQASAPGSSPTLTCRLNGISTGQLSTWRRQFRQGELTGFVPVAITPEPATLPAPAAVGQEPRPGSGGVIEVELPTGVKLRVTGDVGEAALRRVLAALS